ncbi:MAG: hypothetical protein AAB424_04480 [Patescibacteria group bacterium]
MLRLRNILRPFATRPVWGAVAFVCVALIGLWAFVPQVAQAVTLEGVLLDILGYIIGGLVSILGAILIKFIGILVVVAQFNNFIDAPAVKIGWSVTRDMANMFFIVALLLIAIGTMFRIDQYRYSRTLSKLIVMAILINFSKAIAGLFIDFSQVVMLTFVNAFKDQAAGSLSAGFGIDKLMTISNSVSAAGGDINSLSVVGSLFAALIMVFVATVIVVIFTILLIQRIIMLWIYIVLAPTAYMVAVLPGSLGSWWSKWWGDFSQQLIKGPVIAFFLWLALTIITLSTGTLIPTSTLSDQQNKDLGPDQFDKPIFVSEATTGTAIINYLVAIGMLIAGLQQATKAGGAAGAVAGKWMGNFNKWGSAIATSPIKLGQKVLERPAYGTAGAVLGAASKIPLVGGTFGKLNARLTRHRQKQEDKDSDWVNYADQATVQRLATSRVPALTEGGRRDQKNARERMLRNNEVKNLEKESDREKVLSSYHRDIGRKFDAKTGRESFVDASGGKLLNDAIERDPTILTAGWNNIDASEQKFRTEKMQKIMSKMSPTEMAKMNPDAWKNTTFTDAVLKDPSEMFIKRFDKDKFRDSISTNVGSDVRDNMRDAIIAASGSIPSWGTPVPATATVLAHTKGDDYVRFQEDIDRDRQQRTAERVAEFQKRNLNFHESDEYLKNQGQFYDQQSFATNLAQAERRTKRETDRERGAALPVTGASTFANLKKKDGSLKEDPENTLGVSEEVIKRSGIKVTAAGTVIDPGDKQKLADEISKDLDADIAAVEAQIASTPADILDSVQAGSGTGTTTRQAMDRQLKILRGTQQRLQDPSQLGSLKFINADRYGGNVRNAKAEEDFHEKLQEMDTDGSFREQLRQSMSPEELQKIVTEQRAIPGQENIDEKKAFEEHLAKGLANLTRETWADTGPNAVKLSSSLALPIQRQAEAKGVKMHDLTLLEQRVQQEQRANVQVPSRFATFGGVIGARARGRTSKIVEGAKEKLNFVTGAATTLGKKTADFAAAPYRGVQGALGNRSDEKARVAAMKVDQQKTAMRYTPEELKQQKKNLAGFEQQTQQASDKLMQEYQEQEQILKTTPDRLVAKSAKEKMQRIRGDLKVTADELKGQRQIVADYEAGLQKSQQKIGTQVGESFRQGEQADAKSAASQKRFSTPTPTAPSATVPPPPPPPSTKSSIPSAPASPATQPGPARAPAPTAKPDVPPPPPPATPQAPKTPVAPTSTSQAAASAAEAPQVDRSDAEPTVTNITNVTQNITNAFKAAPADVRGKLMSINSEALDSALKNSIVWRGLMSYIRNNTAEVQKSEKLGDLGREDLQKRIGKLQGHMDEGNAEAFKNEFGELQSMFSGSGGGGESSPEA